MVLNSEVKRQQDPLCREKIIYNSLSVLLNVSCSMTDVKYRKLKNKNNLIINQQAIV